MPKLTMTKEDFNSKLNLQKQILLENSLSLKEVEDNETLLVHESSKLPYEFVLFVSLHPKVNKCMVGVKSNSVKNVREKFLELHESLPLDTKGKLHDTIKYVSLTNDVKFKELDGNALNSIRTSLVFYKEYFKEFLN